MNIVYSEEHAFGNSM